MQILSTDLGKLSQARVRNKNPPNARVHINLSWCDRMKLNLCLLKAMFVRNDKTHCLFQILLGCTSSISARSCNCFSDMYKSHLTALVTLLDQAIMVADRVKKTFSTCTARPFPSFSISQIVWKTPTVSGTRLRCCHPRIFLPCRGTILITRSGLQQIIVHCTRQVPLLRKMWKTCGQRQVPHDRLTVEPEPESCRKGTEVKSPESLVETWLLASHSRGFQIYVVLLNQGCKTRSDPIDAVMVH